MPPAPVSPSVGLGVLHLFFSLRREALPDPQGAGGEFVAMLRAFDAVDGQQVLAFSVVGQKADFGLMALSPDFAALDTLGKDLSAGGLGPALLPAASYVSLTELSEYTATAEDEQARLAAEGVAEGTPEHDEAMSAFTERMQAYAEHRLHPRLPQRRVLCFYPMSKRRAGDDNWFRLGFSERKRLMAGHAEVGRRYRGRVLQLITGSTGLDDWEWGVTLLADDPVAIKEIVYEMRFDEVSARFAEFGPFVTGLVLEPEDLAAHLRLA